jgi:hypothetical protein
MLLTILVGTYFYITCGSEFDSSVTEEPKKEAAVLVKIEPTSYPFAFSNDNYAYKENNNHNFYTWLYVVFMPFNESIETGITSLKSFLLENTGKVINITNYYISDETNDSAFPNLGLARANAIKNHLVPNGISLASMNTMGKLIDDMIPDDDIHLDPIV